MTTEEASKTESVATGAPEAEKPAEQPAPEAAADAEPEVAAKEAPQEASGNGTEETVAEPQEAAKEATEETPEVAPAQAAEEAPVEAAAEAPKEESKEKPKEESKEESKDDSKASPDEAPKEAPKEGAGAAPEKTPIAQLWETAKSNGHPEIWGVTLADPDTHVPSQIVLQKYLNANDGDLVKAKDQLVKTLEWRAKTKPLELMKKAFEKGKFGGLGYVTTYTGDAENAASPENKEVFTWNIYGGVKSIDETFGSLEGFIEWRVALMELALAELSISTATEPITAEHDPYKMYQVHDYKSISFLRQSPRVKAASTETIKIFAQNYPELLLEKFFVNVPAIMGFVYAFMKLFVAAKTIRKFHPMSNGGALAAEFSGSKVKALGDKLPAEYGGKGKDLKEAGKETELE